MLFLERFFLAYTLSPRMQVTTQTLFNDIKSLQHHQENNSLGFRIQFHQYAESLFKEHPFIGIGTGDFLTVFHWNNLYQHGEKLNEPHGQYWLTLAEQGLIGITLLFLFLGTLFITFSSLKKRNQFF